MSTYPLAEGLPELRAAIAAWIGAALRRRRSTPTREVVPTLGSKEAIFHLAQVVGGGLASRSPTPGYPVAERGAAFAGKRGARAAAAAERGFLPDLDARRHWARIGDPVAQLPEQPDRRDRAARALRARRRARARARLRRSPATRPTRELYFGARAARLGARSSPTAATCSSFNTLSKRSSMPGYRSRLRRRRPRGDRRAQALPPQRRRRAARSSSSARRSPPGATRSTSRRCARATAPSATSLLPALEAAGLRHAGGDATFFLWLDAGERRRGAAPPRCSSAASSSRPARSSAPAGEGYLRARARADARRVRARGGAAGVSRWRAGRR